MPFDINAQGDIVGAYDAAGDETYGFLMRNGVFTRIEFPDVLFTRAFGINARGWIVGDYHDTNRVRYGFMATK